MALDANVLRDSFNLVADREPQVMARFYDTLFTRYPESRALFGRHSAEAQQRMLQEAIVATIDHLDNEAWLVENLAGLGQKHVSYGVTEEMYGWVGESLLATLAEVAGPAWTPQLSQAWTDAYGAISSLMLSGAERAMAS